jgi:uncharacterized protein YcaQ
MEMSLDTARTLAVVKQGLHRRPATVDRRTLLDTIRQIGLLQLDTIHVVARSHYLVMLSRVGLYDRADLDGLLYPDRRLFEQWAHAACLIPIEAYEYFAPAILARREQPLQPWLLRSLGQDAQQILDAVLADVRERGPLASKDFKDPRDRRGTWWDWKPAKTALEILFEGGYLMVDRRENFQRYYDLAERVLPASARLLAAAQAGGGAADNTLDDWRRWATLRSVACLGVATAAQVSDYYRQRKLAARAMVETLAAEGAIVPVEVEGWQDTAYLDPADLPLVDEIKAGGHQPTLTTFLSPFDNLIWDRQRVADLFGFDYRAEMYQPVAKRQYGYYVLPILHRGQLVGRLDPKADRQAGTLIVRALYLEPGQSITGGLLAGVAGALGEFMAFHRIERLVIERSDPEVLGPLLLERMETC